MLRAIRHTGLTVLAVAQLAASCASTAVLAAQPTPYTRQFDFTDYSTEHPTDQQPGDSLDSEFNSVKETLDETLDNLKLIQADDGTVAVNTIGRDQLKAEVAAGINTPTTWASGTSYTVRDSVLQGTAWYWCQVAHTSGTFATDLSAGKWELIIDFQNAVPITVTDGSVTNTKFRNSAAVSVIGRSANSTGTPADIACAANGNVLRRASNALGCGQIDLTDNTNAVSGALKAASGGTGISSYTVGDITYASSTTGLAKLADVAVGSVLVSGGVGAAPSYAPVDATSMVAGTLPSGNGGTGNAFFGVAGPTTSTKLFTFPDRTATVRFAGKETIYVPAAAMTGATTNGAVATTIETSSNKVGYGVLDFDDTTVKYAWFNVWMPKSYNGGTITFAAGWQTAGTNTGAVLWGLQCRAFNDLDTLDAAYGTGVTVSDSGTGTANLFQATAESGAVTVAGSPVGGSWEACRVYRDAAAGGDTLTGNARLIGVKIFYTASAGDDS